MAKKRVKKKASKKKSKKITRKRKSVTHRTIRPRVTGIERGLTANFVSLQKIMVDSSEKISKLTNQISQLLELFEVSAKTFAEKDFKGDKEIAERLDKLMEQNKVIAKGLTLFADTPSKHEEVFPKIAKMQQVNPIQRNPQYPSQTPQQPTVIQNTPQASPPTNPQQPTVIQNINQSETSDDTYQKSIASQPNSPIKLKTVKPLQPRTPEEESYMN